MWAAVPGAFIAAFALREIFRDLFHPSQSGSLSDYVARFIFRLFRTRRSLLPLAGPLSLVIVIFCWAFLLSLGFALIYWGSFPDAFQLSTGRDPKQEHAFQSVLYFSLEVLTTLGLGDVAPRPEWLRFTVTMHALFGISLITASVSWIVLLYPALARMRALARHATMLARAEQVTGVDAIDSGDPEYLLSDLALEVIRTRVDLVHFPIIYYFYSDRETVSLASSIPNLVHLAEDGCRKERPAQVRLAAMMLREALDDLARLLGERFVSADPNDPDAVFRAYAKEHQAERR
jgi:hypothetical protein